MTSTTHPKDLATKLDAFAAAYGTIARLLLGPADRDLLEKLADPQLLATWPMERDPATRRGLTLLEKSVAAHEDVDQLASDYQALFVGPNPMLAPPYESVHLTRERLIFDTPTFEVRSAYAAFGMQAPRFNREPDDHLGLEFSFLGLVCTTALDALECHDDQRLETVLGAQRSFLSDHLLRWGDACLEAMLHHARTRFYQGVGALGLGVLSNAASWLA